MSSTAAADLLMPVLSAEEALAVLGSLDLTMVRRKIADPNEGKGWDEGQLDLAEREYRCFLALHLMYPEAEVVPCHLVDEFWHQQLLDTHAYARNCLEVFGFFLHHFPYFGMRGEQDAMAFPLPFQLRRTVIPGVSLGASRDCSQLLVRQAVQQQ